MIEEQLNALLLKAIDAGGSEPEIVRNFTDAAGTLPTFPTLNIRAAFIHQRPYAFFVDPPSIAGRTKCEFGDILYVFKEVDGAGKLIAARASFVQVKKGDGHWDVEPHQLEFLGNIERIQFRFGASVYKQGGYAPVIYNGLRHQGELAHYLLLGFDYALSYSVARIAARQPLYQHGFLLHEGNALLCDSEAPFCTRCDSHLRFLRDFFKGQTGASLEDPLREIVALIYKRIGWELDPPEEFADNFIDDPRGFAVIEITSMPENRWREEEPRG